MSQKKHRYTVIRRSGNTKVFDDAPYFGVLRSCFHEHQSGGSNYDHPNMLLRDGEVVVEKDLCDLAWDYCTQFDKEVAETAERVNGHHRPEWDKEG